jgi:hypothetical protein
MEFVFFVVCVLAALEWLLRVFWADPYFLYGIPVFQGTTRARRPTAVELDLGSELAGMRLNRESFREVRFRWTLLDINDLDFGIHGRILELKDGRHRIVAFLDLWPHLGAAALALGWWLDGARLAAVGALAVAAAVIPFQRRRALRIRQVIDQAG